MSNNYDAFGDVIENVSGIFGEDQPGLDAGLKKHDSVHAEVASPGVVMQVNCQGCGKTMHLTASWPEVIALKYGVNPGIAYRNVPSVDSSTRWEYLPHEHAWRPHMQCGNCRWWIPLRITPDEPERFLAAGRRRELFNPQAEAQLANHCAQIAQQGQGVRR